MTRAAALERALEQNFADSIRRLSSLTDEVAIEVPAQRWMKVALQLRDATDLRFEMLMDLAGVDYLDYGRDEWKTASATRSGFSRGVLRTALAVENPASSASSGLTLHDTEDGAAVAVGPNAAGAASGVQAAKAATRVDSGAGGFARGAADADSRSHPARFAVVYHLLSITHNWRLRVRVYCEGEEDPAIDSVIDVWAAANWFEREAFDLFGILFRGHPDLRRLLTDYGFIGHPFRKDFPLIGNVEVRYDPTRRRVVYEPVTIEPRVLVPKVIRHDNRYDAALRRAPQKAN